MKKTLVFVCLLLFFFSGIAQQTNPANNKEVQDKIKQAQQQLDKLTPEQKKMMEQMGFSTNTPSLPNGTTDAQIALAVGGDGVPKKNTVLIGAIPKIVLTSATVSSYIKTLNEYVEKNISAQYKPFGQQVYASLKTNHFKANEIANAALGYWVNGDLEPAVYLMSKACSDNSADDDMLSNFAAMLSMAGAPHRAIPLLEYLLKKYPDNTTIQNNLGQAWFYLGDVDKANVQLDKVVRAFAYHPQANYTQCLIQESKGNKTAAIEKMKNSLHYSYSLGKVNKLRKLGYSVKGSDMRKPFRPDPDPLALEKFVRPEAPKSYEDELRLSADWDAFQKQVYEKMNALAQASIPAQQANAKEAERLYNQYQKGGVTAMTAKASSNENIYRKTAEKNLEEMNKDGGAAYRLKAAKKQIDDLRKDFVAKDELQRKTLEKANSTIATSETELAKKGENIGYDNCVVQNKYSEWVYKNYNLPLEEAYNNYLHQLKLKITEELYWRQFTENEATFESTKNNAKREWLAAISDTRNIATNKYGNCNIEPTKSSNYKLSDFDDMHCKFISVLDFGVYKQVFECGKSRMEFNAGGVSGNFNFKSDNAGKNQFTNGNIEVSAGKEISVSKGPLQVGASVKGGMGMEFSSNGVEDVYVTGEASVSAGAGPANIEVGASGKMSLISGNMSGGISGFGK
ncbi:tetratricopeptide repeat protein [Parafilimonas terrae]|uniref:Uncharacterized protein n=1 Tax=Parafilimonas terrae TaxID=1465490 RepID=A0A1I5YDG8_9BACT|nr:tetratricopeptide repeat protein [Parafilimonas terrae]SFQ42249.1 hypothetical protein SAMN05444277_111131 [Parafilimonas terrae]